METEDRAGARTCVIVVSYNTRDLLLECLDRVMRHPPARSPQEVVVVDNGSRDGSAEAVRARFPAVRVLANATNRGFAAANNQAIRATTGDYVLLLNSDALARDDTVAALTLFMDQHSAVGLAGCRLLNPDGSLQQSCFRYATLWRSVGDALLLTNLLQFLPWADDYRHWPHNRTRKVAAVSGACVIARRRAIEQVGLLDERFFMYAEDNDWCRRFRQAGWQVAFTPATEVVHAGGGSHGPAGARALALAEESNRRYMLKYYGVPGCWLWSVSALLGSLLRLALQRLLRRSDRARRGSGTYHHRARVAWHTAYWRRVWADVTTSKVEV